MKTVKFYLLFLFIFSFNFTNGQIRESWLKNTQRRILLITSVQSLYIETYTKTDSFLMSATGFIIKSKTKYYLITNYHVLFNIDPMDTQWASIHHSYPYYVKIFYQENSSENPVVKKEKIIDASKNYLVFTPNDVYDVLNKIQWKADVAALPLSDTNDIKIYPIDYSVPIDSILQPTDIVCVVGYPLGYSSYKFYPIYETGFIASDPDLDWDNKPIILIDANVYRGMSGSPVYKTDPVSGKINFIGMLSDITPSEKNKNGEVIGDAVFAEIWKSSYLRDFFKQLP